MSDESQSPSPEIKIKNGSSIEDMKQSIRVIEGLFHAINGGTFPLKWCSAAMQGMQFLNAVHASLIKELGPEEVAKIKQVETLKETGQTAGAA